MAAQRSNWTVLDEDCKNNATALCQVISTATCDKDTLFNTTRIPYSKFTDDWAFDPAKDVQDTTKTS